MTTPVTAACPRCHEAIVIEYALLGSAMGCPHCLHKTVPEVPIGGTIPPSGYQLTFRDFNRLLEPGAERVAAQPLLLAWFGATVASQEGRSVVLGGDGVPINLVWLHLQIQNDSDRRQELYQLAMSLWR